MNTTSIELDKIYDLAFNVLKKYGCDEFNAEAVATTVTNAERDGSVSHGLFRIPGYVSSLKSKKVKGNSNPSNIYQLQKIKPMYEINNLGANVFNSLLKNYNFVLKRIETLKKSKKYFEDEIQKMGFLTYDTHGNFSNIYFGDKTFLIHKNLKKIIYFKKNFEHHSMKGITRISTTNKKNFIKILNHIRKFKND